jgi:hypothetical protein
MLLRITKLLLKAEALELRETPLVHPHAIGRFSGWYGISEPVALDSLQRLVVGHVDEYFFRHGWLQKLGQPY